MNSIRIKKNISYKILQGKTFYIYNWANDKCYDECLDTYNVGDAKQDDEHVDYDDEDDVDERDLTHVNDD